MNIYRCIVFGVVGFFCLVIAVGLLLPPIGRTGPVRSLAYEAGLRAWMQAIDIYIEENGELPPTYHLLFHERFVGDYPVSYEHSFASREHLSGTDDFAFGTHDCRSIAQLAVSAEELKATAERLHVQSWSWEPVTDFWISREMRDWSSNSPEIIVAFARIRDREQGVLVYFGSADRHVTMNYNSPKETKSSLQADRRARERLNLAPLPPEFRTWLLTGEPASVGDGTFIPPKLKEYGLR